MNVNKEMGIKNKKNRTKITIIVCFLRDMLIGLFNYYQVNLNNILINSQF